MFTATDDVLTSYGSACVALFFIFVALGLGAGYITQVGCPKIGLDTTLIIRTVWTVVCSLSLRLLGTLN